MAHFRNTRISTRLLALVAASLVGVLAIVVMATLQIRSQITSERHEGTKAVVETALGVVESYGEKEEAGELTREQAQQQALSVLEGLRYSGDEYFWVNDMRPYMVMHPIKPELDGTDVSGNEDPDGKRLFVEFVEVVEKSGSGFVEYQWPKPGEEAPQPKISYVAGYEPWDWVVGSGVYTDDISAAATAAGLKLAGQSALVLLVIAGLSVAISRSITRPLESAVATMRSGDLSRRLEVGGGRNELDQLSAAVNETIERVAGVVESVVITSGELEDAAQRLSTGSDDMAQSARGTTAQAGEVAAAASQVSSGIDAVAAGAEEMGASIREIAHNAQEAARVAGQAVASAELTNRTVSQLGDSSAQISSVVKVITSIAEQTNLLALNATIEAARAGEAGRGFAVVAGEVKELAQESARAAEGIARQVVAMQEDAERAVTAIAEISEVVGQISDYQTAIASAVEEQTATTNEMSRTVSNAAESGRSIATTISEVATASERTTEEVAGVHSAAEQLVRMSGELQRVVAGFRR